MPKKSPKIWMRAPARAPGPAKTSEAEKQAIIAACEELIETVLKPRFLPEIIPSEERNYKINIHGAWRGGRYKFMQRYRSGFPDNKGVEFDAPFARIDHMGDGKFDIYWMRYTGEWWQVHGNKTLEEALHILQTDNVLFPF
jgi:hypothetical protein